MVGGVFSLAYWRLIRVYSLYLFAFTRYLFALLATCSRSFAQLKQRDVGVALQG